MGISAIITKLCYRKPQTLGEGLQRVVRYVGKGTPNKSPSILKQTPGYREYANGVKIDSRSRQGFYAHLHTGKTEHLGDIAAETDKLTDLKKYAKAANVTVRGRTAKENGKEVVTDVFARGWKAIQKFFNHNAPSQKLYDKQTVTLPNNIAKLNAFCEKYCI